MRDDPTLEVVVIGGGPSGLAAALRLRALKRTVLVLERSQYETGRIGEHLSADGVAALERLGAADLLAEGGHVESPGVVSIWGSADEVELPAIFGPSGAGLHLDRPDFERSLARRLQARGGIVRTGCRVTGVASDNAAWRIDVEGEAPLAARVCIDATGRSAAPARWFGARPLRRDALVGFAARLDASGGRLMPLVEATRDGWWYSAPLPFGQMVAIFFTDADLRPPGDVATAWRTALASTRQTRSRVADRRPAVRGIAAHSQRLNRAWGPGWLAVGDAAMAMDPLASAGLSHGLQSAISAADAAHAMLAGDPEPARHYGLSVDRAFGDYLDARRQHYRWETRWPEATFWRRRHRGSVRGNAIWLRPDARLRARADDVSFARTLLGILPDVGAAEMARMAERPIVAKELGRRVREAAPYEDFEILDALQLMVADGCLVAED